MSLVFYQTAFNEVTNVGCSGSSLLGDSINRRITTTQQFDTIERTLDPGNQGAGALIQFRTVGGVGSPTWEAGNYVVRLNITGVAGTNTWTGTYICERTSGGSFNTVASLTGQSIGLGSTGVKTMTINRGTDFTPAGTDSDLFIVLIIENNDQHGQSSFDILFNQAIDTPILVTETKTVADSGTGTDAVSKTETNQVTVADTATGTDAVTVYTGINGLPPGTDYADAALPTAATTIHSPIVLIDLGVVMPQSWWDNVTINDPRYGRVSFDDAVEEAATQIAAHWLDFDSTLQQGWIWFRHEGDLLSSDNKSIRVYPPDTGNNPILPKDRSLGAQGTYQDFGIVVAGGQTEDISDNPGYDNVISAPSVVTDGIFGDALSFDGAANEIQFRKKVFPVGFDADYTIDAWIRVPSGVLTADNNVVFSENNPLNLNDRTILYELTNFGSATDDMRLFTNEEGVASTELGIIQDPRGQGWIHIIFTKREAFSVDHRSYVNGTIGSQNNQSDDLHGGNIFNIGTDPSRVDRYYEGDIGIFRVRDIGYTEDHVQYITDMEGNQATFWGTWSWQGGAGDQTINVLDAGTGTDTVSVAVQLAVADAMTGADSPTVNVALTVSDAASGADAVSTLKELLKTVADAFTGADAVDIPNIAQNVNVADTATGTDAPSVPEVTVSISEVASGADAIALNVQVSIQDTATGTDVPVLNVLVNVTDLATGADFISTIKQILITVVDSFTGTDAVTVPAVDLTVTDAATGTDSPNITVGISVQDSATGADTVRLNVLVPVSDVGSGADTVSVAVGQIIKSVSDAATGADAVSLNVALSVSDLATGADTVSTLASILKAVSDAGSGADTVSLNIALTVADVAAGTDTVSTLQEILIAVSDAGTGADAVPINVAFTISDTATGADTPDVGIAIQVSDNIFSADVVTVSQDVIKTVTDFANATDAPSVPEVGISITDAASGADAVDVAVNVSVSDNAAAADFVSLFKEQLIQVVDAATGTDAVDNISVLINIADAATGADAINTPFRNLQVSDGASGNDFLDQLYKELRVVEAATGTDAVLRFAADVTILEIEFKLQIRRLEFILKQRSMSFKLTDSDSEFTLKSNK